MVSWSVHFSLMVEMCQIAVGSVDNGDDGFWAMLAAIAAVASALYAYRSNVIAKRALLLATQEYNNRQSNFALYLIDGYRWTDRNEGKRKFLLFHITIKNKSENKNSFKADLEIEYVRTDRSVARAIIAHQSELVTYIPQKNLSAFPDDIRIEEKAIESKWLLFEQPKDVFKEYRIAKYSIRLIDPTGKVEFVECVLIKELSDGSKES